MTYSNISEDDAHPNFVREGIHEGEDAWLLLFRFLDHDGDSQRHERLGEVDDSFSKRRDGQRRHGQVSLLTNEEEGGEKRGTGGT